MTFPQNHGRAKLVVVSELFRAFLHYGEGMVQVETNYSH